MQRKQQAESAQQSIPKELSSILPEDIKDRRKLIIVLEKAGLKVCRVGKHDALLNSDEHKNYIQERLNQNPSDYRPDITHQCLLTLMDSPLNRAGMLKVYITTIDNHVIELHPKTGIPRTFRKFAELMVQLMKKLRIRANQSSETLLKIVKSPVTVHLPPESLRMGTSTKARLVDMNSYVKELPQNAPITFVVGAVAKGNPGMENPYVQDSICISKYPLSASYAISKMLYAFEQYWKVL